MTELAGEIRAARESKRIVAIANTTAASGAYWLAAQASELFVSPSGWVGSIGVYTAHQDVSAVLDRLGVTEPP
jgi:ClpP class serine protease